MASVTVVCNSSNFPAAQMFENISRKENGNIVDKLKNYMWELAVA